MRGAFLVGALSLLCGLAFSAFAVDGLWRPDAFDYAQIARELARGEGFGSRQAIYTLHLEFLSQHGGFDETWPNLHRFPLPSLLMAAGFLLFGVGPGVVILYGLIFQAATAALLFAWGRDAVSTEVGAAAALWITLNGVMLETAAAGLSEPPVMFFVTASLYSMWRLRDVRGDWIYLLPGLLLGLAALARTNAILIAPLLALAIGWGRGATRQRVIGVGALFLGVGLMLAPWALRNLLVAGSPFFSLHSYFLLPSGTDPSSLKWDLDLPWVRSFVSPLDFAQEFPGLVLPKWSANLGNFFRLLPTLGGTLGVALVGLLAATFRSATPCPHIARLVAAAFLVNLFLVSFGDFVFDKYHFHFIPALSLFAAAALASLVGAWVPQRLRRGVFIAIVLLAANLPGVVRAVDSVRDRVGLVNRAQLAFVAAEVPEAGVVFSDQSYAVAWEADRRSIRTHYARLPDGTRVLGALVISDRYLPIDAVYLSHEFLANPSKRRILEATLARVPRFRREFPRLHTFENGALLFQR